MTTPTPVEREIALPIDSEPVPPIQHSAPQAELIPEDESAPLLEADAASAAKFGDHLKKHRFGLQIVSIAYWPMSRARFPDLIQCIIVLNAKFQIRREVVKLRMFSACPGSRR